MNRKMRSVLVLVAMLGAILLSAPTASAIGDEDGGEGVKYCRRVLGLNSCVAVMYGECTLWVSAGIGGCFAVNVNEATQ